MRSIWVKGKEDRKTLGHRDREVATRYAYEFLSDLVESERAIENNLTLGLLQDLYLDGPQHRAKTVHSMVFGCRKSRIPKRPVMNHETYKKLAVRSVPVGPMAATAGGWRDERTILTSYQQVDAETVKQVVLHPTQRLSGTKKLATQLATRSGQTTKPHRLTDDEASRSTIGAPGFEPGTSCSRSRRATRLRYAPPYCSISIRIRYQ